MRLRTKLLIVFSSTAIFVVILVGLAGIIIGKRSLEKEAFNKLTAIRELKANHIEAYLEEIRNQLNASSENFMAIDAMKEFKSAFYDSGKADITEEEIDRSLKAYYSESFIPRLNENTVNPFSAEKFYPADLHTKLLQYQYISENNYEIGQKKLLDSSKWKDDYSKVHAKYHPIFRNYLEKFGYYDLFLIDTSGHIIYSVFKEIDFATSLNEDAFKNSNLAEVFREVKGKYQRNFVKLIDYKEYLPSYNGHASFIASGIFEGDEMLGVLVFQLPIDRINNIMTDNLQWEKVGLGKTGETYIVGRDQLLRNQSRFLIEAKGEYLDMLSKVGVADSTVNKIDHLDNSIGLQRVNTIGVRAALNGETGTDVFSDYRGVSVLSSYRPLVIKDVDWIILSEIDEEEAFSTISSFVRNLLLLSLTLVILIPLIAYFFSRSLTRPLDKLTAVAQEMAAGNLKIQTGLCRKDEIGSLACNFDTMSESISQMMDKLEEANSTLELKVQTRTQEIANAHERIKSIIDNANDAIITVNEQQNIISLNTAGERIFGYEGAEIIGKSLSNLLPAEYVDSHPLHISKFQDEEVTSRLMNDRLEIKGRRKNGEIFPAEASISKQQVDGSYQFTAFLKDISQRKKAEAEILRQKKLLEDTIESLSYPFYVVDTNDYTIKMANSAAKRLGMEGSTTCHALSHHSDTPCNSETDPCPLVEVKRTKNPFKVEHIHFDENGDEKYVEVHGYPIFDSEGEVIQMIEYSLDITERKKAEQQIIISENMFRSISASASDAIISINNRGIIEFWNEAAKNIFGYSKKEVSGKLLDMIIPEKHRKGHSAGVSRVVGGGKKNLIGRTVEIEGKRKNGEVFPIELSISNWEGEDGINFSSIIRDITTRKEMELKVEEANKRMESELNIGRDIQMSMLPLIFPAFPKRKEIDIFANLIPAREVGGDFYDFYFIDEDRFCFTVGDVSGKGVPGALMMAVTKTLLKSRAGTDLSTASILTHVNNEIAKENDAYMFITVFIAILDLSSGEMVYSNAGHNPTYILNSEKNELRKLAELHGPVVGAMEEMTFTESITQLSKDDLVIAYTDGVTESQNSKEELYSDQRFSNLLNSSFQLGPKELIEKILKDVKAFEDGAEQFDDITLLAIKLKQNPSAASVKLLNIEINNQLNSIQDVVDQFEAFGNENLIPQPLIHKCNIVFDEMLNNVISYGYVDESEHFINLEIEFKNKRLMITIVDDGIPFNPFGKNPPDTKLSIEERNIGGLGIHIVKNLMDEYRYVRNVDKNVVTLVKYNVKEEQNETGN
jgi:PAS domain S-box-containing protein